jgi:hypothetical protein
MTDKNSDEKNKHNILKKIIYTRNSHILREINKIVIKDQDVI